MSGGHYDVAQICENGHVITARARGRANLNQDFCDTCGARTIVSCPSCSTDIRGHYHVPGVIGFGGYSAPAYCHSCGKPFPWTESSMAAAEELVEEMGELTSEERELLKRSLHELVRETPKTRVAETRFKRLMKKAGSDGYDAMRSVLTDVVSETVRKTLFGV